MNTGRTHSSTAMAFRDASYAYAGWIYLDNSLGARVMRLLGRVGSVFNRRNT